MSKWRPTTECIYVIPDIHGQFNSLSLILKRILPLRPTDKLIFLGDYIDRGPNSDLVVEKLIELKKEYKDQVVCIGGNHEWLLLASIGKVPYKAQPRQPTPYSVWMQNGGQQCVKSYADRMGLTIDDFMALPSHRVAQFIPEEHSEFLLNLPMYYEMDNYIFVHAGCDPMVPLENQSSDLFLWDRSLFDAARRLSEKGIEYPWEKTIVCGHSAIGPFINQKYMMLDASSFKKLMVLELNSMEAFYAIHNKKRLVPVEIVENKLLNKKKTVFRRVT